MYKAPMKKGSPEGYNAETGLSEPAQKPISGEPNERHSSYRIRCPQEKHQLLREGSRWPDRGGRQTAGNPRETAPMGQQAYGTVAGWHGSDAVQRLDLRRAEAVRSQPADRTSGADESNRRLQKEERQAGCAEDRRSGALQSFSGLLYSAGLDPGTSAHSALPQPGGGSGGAHEKQDEWPADGSRRGIQQTTPARREVLHGITGLHRRCAGFRERSAATQPGRDGDVRTLATAAASETSERSVAQQTGEIAGKYSWCGPGHGVDVVSGSGRSAAVLFSGKRYELLRAHAGADLLGRQTTTCTALEAAQRAAANRASGGGETGSAVESATGGAPRARTGTRRSQSGHAGSRAE